MKTFEKDIKEMMNAWDLSRYIWIKKFGSDAGFLEWFSERVKLNNLEGVTDNAKM